MPQIVRKSFVCHALLLLAPVILAESAVGAAEVTSWTLTTMTLDNSGNHQVTDREDILIVTNPLAHVSETGVGSNQAVTSYDHWWIPDAGLASFHTEFDHHIETLDVRTISQSTIRFIPDGDSLFSVDSTVTYAHAPGDENVIDFAFALVDLTASNVLTSTLKRGGNGLMLPAAGTLDINGEFDLVGGHLYRMTYFVDLRGESTGPMNGPFDADGYIQVTITPEPAAALLLVLHSPVLIRRRRRSA